MLGTTNFPIQFCPPTPSSVKLNAHAELLKCLSFVVKLQKYLCSYNQRQQQLPAGETMPRTQWCMKQTLREHVPLSPELDFTSLIAEYQPFCIGECMQTKSNLRED